MLHSQLMKHLETADFPAPESVVHLFVGGSELHGAKVNQTDDLDVYGVFIERPEEALGLISRPHFVWSTADDERRNGPDDVDLTLYSLRRWAQLAAKGNATALHFLFARATAVSTPLWMGIERSASIFLAKHSAQQFIGFAENQRKRITGELGQGKKGFRPEYECIHGYDTKAAMHTLRLYFECKDLLENTCITLPRPERDLLIRVRQGEFTLQQFQTLASDLESEAVQAAVLSALPDQVDATAISKLIARVHREFWQTSALAQTCPHAGDALEFTSR